MASASEEIPLKTRACTVSRDVQNFDLLIEDMHDLFGDEWGDLGYLEAAAFLADADSSDLELLAIALDDRDEDNVTQITAVIAAAKARKLKVLLIAEALGPIMLHQLLRAGADDFVPYPLPENALREAIDRIDHAEKAKLISVLPAVSKGRNGVVFCVQALAGGAGATTFAVNLAWELSKLAADGSRKVCILDFDLQAGSVSTYLDLPRTEKVFEMLSQTATMDSDAFFSAIQVFQEKLHVLTAPAELLPLDLLSPDEIERVIAMAKDHFDYVIIDMPRTFVHWSDTCLHMCEIYFALFELDLRSAQNLLRMIRSLKAEGLDLDKHRFILNRAPRFTDLSGKARAKRMAESLGISIAAMLPEGNTQVRDANDHGLPLADYAPKNPLCKEIQKFAASLLAQSKQENQAAE